MVEQGLRVAIVKEGFPTEAMKKDEELRVIQAAIIAEVEKVPVGDPLPLIRDTYLARGAVVAVCEDQNTVDWLGKQVPNMTPWEGSRLAVVGMEALPTFKKVALWIPGPSATTPVFFDRLERLNTGLRTGAWRVWERRNATAGVRLIVSMDASTVELLGARGMRLYCGAGMATVTLLTEEKKKQ